MQRDLPEKDMPWDRQADEIANYMRLFSDTNATVAIETKSIALVKCARFARKLCNGNDELFEQFKPYAVGQKDRFLMCARVILTTYADLRSGKYSFFGVLLESELAGLVSQSARKAWEKKYPFEGENSERTTMCGEVA